MLTMNARNMKKSAYMRSELEASKVAGQKVQKILFKKPFSSAVKSIPFGPVVNGRVQKMHTELEKRRRKKKRKEKRKRGFFSFHMRSGHFWNL